MHMIVISTLAILLYLVAAVLLGIRLRNRVTSPSSKWKGLLAAGLATLLHAWILGGLVFTSQGINLGVFNAISLVTWLISAILVSSAFKRPTENLGIIAFPVTGLAVVLQNTFTASHITETMNSPIEIHILISIAATSLLSIAAAQAVLLTIQDRQLRNKRPGGFIRALPPLQAMERFLFQVIGLGFALQTLSLLSGFSFLDDMFAQHLVHKTILSIVAWLVFATLLWGRKQFGWRGKTAIRWTLSGFGVLILAYIGSKIVQELILN